mmetsp:Transcript_32823/g.79789  ORF Transcript_32823/g.79789 Transcript_32823/m.79789 type:complete len:638 (+) Transcript_32823:734-2647(+)
MMPQDHSHRRPASTATEEPTSHGTNEAKATTTTTTSTTTSSGPLKTGRRNSLLLDGIEFDISNLLDRKNDAGSFKSHSSIASNNNTSSTLVTARMGDSMTMSSFSSRRSSCQSSLWSSSTSRSLSLENSSGMFYLGDSMRSVDQHQLQSTDDDVITETQEWEDDAESHFQQDSISGGGSSGSSGSVSITSRSVRSLPQHLLSSPPPSRVIRRSVSSRLPTFQYPSPKDIPRDDDSLNINVDDLFRRRFSRVLQYQQGHQRRTLTKHRSDSAAVLGRPGGCAAYDEHDDETRPDLDRHVSEVSKGSSFSNESGNSDGQNSHGQESVQSNADSTSSSIVTQITKNLGRKEAKLRSIATFGSGRSAKNEDGSSYVENSRVYTVRYRPPPPRMYQRETTTTQHQDGVDDHNPHRNLQDRNLEETMNLQHDDYTTILRDDSSDESTSTSRNTRHCGYLSKHHPRRNVRRSASYSDNGRSVRFSSHPYEGGLAPLPSMKRRSRSDEGSALPSSSATGEWDDDLRGHNHQLRALHRRRSSMTSPVRSSSGRSLFPGKGKRTSKTNGNEKVYEQKLVEVTPGTFVPLRGSDETWDCIKSGQTVTTCCTGCSVRLYCIETVSMVMCPDCDLIFPNMMNDDSNQAQS